MKVLDLKCPLAHTFEGWFASENEFQRQRELGLIECPYCGRHEVEKQLSAPRLNLARVSVAPEAARVEAAATPALTQQQRWLEATQRILEATSDVGEKFAEEARKMHYGDAPARGIRGQASLAETSALVEEGIEVLPFLMPDAFKQTLQ